MVYSWITINTIFNIMVAFILQSKRSQRLLQIVLICNYLSVALNGDLLVTFLPKNMWFGYFGIVVMLLQWSYSGVSP